MAKGQALMVLPFLAALAPFAPLIGGAIGAVGQLMAPKPKASAGSIDLKGLRRDAEEAGFNPLTIIRGGGGADDEGKANHRWSI